MAINSTINRDLIQNPVILNPESVSAPSIEYAKMASKWKLHVALWGGTEEMRRGTTRWLPQEDAESNEAYNARLEKTFLYNGYKSTIQRLAGQVFFRPVVVENLPSELEYMEKDFDSEGRTITEVAHECLVDMLRFGKSHGIVDYPSESHDLTVEEERQLKIRPYFTRIDPRDLIAWRSRRVGGADILDQLRIQEYSVEPYNEYQEVETFRVRVFYPDRVDVFTLRYNADEETYKLEESFPFTLGEIPLVTAYGTKTGFLTAEPPLDDLAWLNLRHWQSTSEQNSILHASRVPLFFAKGFEEGELTNVTIGPYSGIVTSKSDADISYIEHTGRAIGAGETDLEKLKKEMHEIGADLLVSRSVSHQTASARSIDRAESLSMLQTMVISLERALENAFIMAGNWMGIDASNVNVSISDEFAVPGNEANPVEDLDNLYERGIITREEYRFELSRRGTLSDVEIAGNTYFKEEEKPQNELSQEESNENNDLENND